LRFPWREARATLLDLAGGARDTPVHLAYVNPLTGDECLPTLGCSALMIRPGEARRFRRRSASAALHVIEGSGDADIDGQSFSWSAHDVLAVPSHARFSLSNRSAKAPAFVFMVDDAPMQRKMQIYRELDWGTSA
jgi:gentisate 1,2-dioxygenase